MAGLEIPVATAADLVVMKLLARDDASRPQDAADLAALRKVVSRDDLQQMRRYAALVGSRGYARERDLRAALDAWWRADDLPRGTSTDASPGGSNR